MADEAWRNPDNKSGYYPTGDLVLIKPLEPAEKSSAGIVFAKITQDKEAQAAKVGYLWDSGHIAHDDPRLQGINYGDMIAFARYSGDSWLMDGQLYFIVRVGNVTGRADRIPDYILGAAKSTIEVFGAN